MCSSNSGIAKTLAAADSSIGACDKLRADIDADVGVVW